MTNYGKKIYDKFTGQSWGKSLRGAIGALRIPGIGGQYHPSEGFVAAISLVKTVLAGESGVLDDDDISAVRAQFAETLTHEELAETVKMLRTAPLITAAVAAEALKHLSVERKKELIFALLVLDIGKRDGGGRNKLISEFALESGIAEEELGDLVARAESKYRQRQLILSSGTGLLAALGVIAVFILTATILKSVIFGLILAYIMLPLEQYFEKSLKSRKGVFFHLARICALPLYPLRKISQKLKRNGKKTLSAEEQARVEMRKINARAVSLTAAVLFFAAAALIFSLFFLSKNYVNKVVRPVNQWAAGQTSTVPGPTDGAPEKLNSKQVAENFIAKVKQYLETHRDNVESNPLVRFAVEKVSLILNDSQTQKELLEAAAKRTGGVFSFATGMLGGMVRFAVDVLLTVFFFLLFLSKIAEFCSENKSASRPGEYLVRTVFSGSWMPRASEGVLEEARRIIGEIINKLRIWLRGYLLLIGIDIVIYTLVYYLLAVPYFFILGPITAFCVLLPVIGPLSATVLAMLVTLAAGGANASLLQIVGIFGIYVIQNTVIEQFILYPLIFGEALGLTLLETIIVVLLGGIFAGIAGMIFALPTAAIIKYLVPQIYNCWGKKHEKV